MPRSNLPPAAILDALGEPALIVDQTIVVSANAEAKAVLGSAIVDRDVRMAIRHPQALDAILGGREGRIGLVGVGSAERHWQMTVNKVGKDQILVRLADRSDVISAERMRTDFVANASHELRTPLATLIGYGETLAEPGELDEALRVQFGQTIHREARRMQRIVDDLMSLSRIEAGRYRTPSDRVDLRNVVGTSVLQGREQAERADCSITFDSADEPMIVTGDASQLAQLVDNLIGNALRYGCNDRSCKVEVGLEQGDSRIVLTVRDHGDGIDSEHLPRLTERFYRVDAARSRESGGTGLGLAIVKHIVERHRATLSIQSQRGKGTIVTVNFPAA